MIHVLRVDEDLERAALLVGRAGIEHYVVDGDVERVFEQRRFDLVGHADQGFRALQAFVHLHHVDLASLVGGGGGGRALKGLVDHFETLDALVDLDGHGAVSPVGRQRRRRWFRQRLGQR
ncbi:hypothetical protein D9M68_946290 [compost metagenome]